MELKINPEYEALLPKLTEPEFQELKESIRKDGLHYTLAINKGGVILDGHHRLRACRELGIEPKVEVKVFENVLLEKKFVIESNLKRRHLNKFQRGKLVLPLLEIEKELAKQRQGERTDLTGTSGKYFPDVTKPKRQRKPLTQEQKEARKLKAKLRRDEKKKTGIELKKPNRARTNVARKVQLSDRTLEKVKDILDKGSEELKQKVESGQTSISYAHKIIKRQERKINQPPLPKEKFNVIYADPPWEYNLGLRGDPAEHYSTMTQEQILALKIPTAEDAILFLWATNPKLEEALQVMKAWGFEYKTNLVWVKDKFGTGYYVRGQHELLLIGKKGLIPIPDESKRPSSVFFANRENHSKKPEKAYELIEQMYPNCKNLELFATKTRAGWTAWGAQIGEKTN